MKALPLAGIRVVDLTMMWAGPYATKMLAEMGAEVIKVESPRAWDNLRTLVPQDPEPADPWNSAYYFNEYNHHKKSVTLDLADERGRDVLFRLVAQSDVLIENYRADVMDTLGLTEDVLRRARPDLVIVSMAGFGKTGPDRDNVGFGPIIEMMSGLMSLSGYGDEDVPYKTGISYGDPVAGVASVGAVAMALIQRRRTGKGVTIDLAQRETGAKMAGAAFVASGLTGSDPAATGNRSPHWAPQGCYPARGDDQWIVVSCTDSAEWASCAELVGRPDLAVLSLDERFERHDELDEVLTRWSAPLDPRVAVDELQAAGVPAGRVLDMGTIKDDPHLHARGFWVRIPNPKMHPYRKHGIVWRLLEANPRLARRAPWFGEHNEEILGGLLGLSRPELDSLTAAGIIADAPTGATSG
ncbi:MAG: CoA transferase [Actinomycetia bacterium]|nr:CoA transferase [Actinomycetes bacterium]